MKNGKKFWNSIPEKKRKEKLEKCIINFDFFLSHNHDYEYTYRTLIDLRQITTHSIFGLTRCHKFYYCIQNEHSAVYKMNTVQLHFHSHPHSSTLICIFLKLFCFALFCCFVCVNYVMCPFNFLLFYGEFK